MAVLVDSSVWIAADRKASREHTQLKDLITGGRESICVCRPIVVEVCQGARTQQEFEYLWSGMQGFIDLAITDEHWEKSAQNFMRLRKKGLSVSTLDCLIATLALNYHVQLWSIDQIFMKMTKYIPLELI